MAVASDAQGSGGRGAGAGPGPGLSHLHVAFLTAKVNEQLVGHTFLLKTMLVILSSRKKTRYSSQAHRPSLSVGGTRSLLETAFRKGATGSGCFFFFFLTVSKKLTYTLLAGWPPGLGGKCLCSPVQTG